VFGWSAAHPDAYWPPGAPFLYSLAFRALGIGGAAVVALNLVLAVAKLALAFSLVRTWFGRRAAVLATAALACWPTQIALTTVLSSEHPFDVALLAAVWAFERGWRDGTLAADAVIGVALAAASYVRPTALPLAAGFALIAWTRGAPLGRVLRLAFAASAVMALLIAPWSARNHRVFGRWVAVSANGGANLWMGNNPTANGGYVALPREVRDMNTAERNAYLGDAAKRWMRENPGRALALAVRKLAITYGRETIGVVWNERALAPAGPRVELALKALCSGFWWLALLAALAGAALRLRAHGLAACFRDAPIALWGYFALVHAVTVGQDRYHLASVPFIAALAAYAICELAGSREVPA
jgi:Dolichyl-phosphate-mannose-protein mannosyltransferase